VGTMETNLQARKREVGCANNGAEGKGMVKDARGNSKLPRGGNRWEMDIGDQGYIMGESGGAVNGARLKDKYAQRLKL